MRLRVAFGQLVVIAIVGVSSVAGPGLASDRDVEATEDAELRGRIETQLREQLPQETGAAIRVLVRDGQVVLQGQVPLFEQSLRAEQVSWKTSGVRDVDNELRVVPLGAGSSDAAIAGQVRTVIKGDGRFLDTSLEIEVQAGVVKIGGIFQNPADVLALKHRVAAIPGVMDVEIDAILVAGGRAVRGTVWQFPNEPGSGVSDFAVA